MSLVILVLLLTVVTNAASQLSLKRGLNGLHPGGPDTRRMSHLVRAATNPFLLGWLVLTAASTAFWLVAISLAELSLAYPFLGLNVVLITTGSAIFLREPVTPRHWVAVLLIMVGTVLVARG
jgi:drug/metabolite transporter (DMT)-like permease